MNQPLTLVSFDLCPYVQRAAIVLGEKGVPYERINIDLANKPDWFKAISPLGTVPLLKVGEDVVFESMVIAEYLDETQPGQLNPSDPLVKARHRGWMEFGSSILGDVWVLETTADAVAFDAKVGTVKQKLARLEVELGDGPLFAGAAFSLVDAVFAPIFRIFDGFDAIRDLGLLDGLPKVSAWRKALAERQSVSAAVVPDFQDRLLAFLKRQNGVLAASFA